MPCSPNIFSTPPNLLGGEVEAALGGKAHLRHSGRVDLYGPVNFLGQDSGAGVLKWAKATANWTNVTGNGSYVTCRKVDDRSGTNPGDAVTLYLPRPNSGDPNVRSGSVVAYCLEPGGEAVCVSPYMDDKIGSLKAWKGVIGDIPGGWTVATSLGGRVPAGYISADATYGTIGATGGATTHSHASGTSGSNTTGITVDNHAAGNTGSSSGTTSSEVTGITLTPVAHTHTYSESSTTAAVAAGTAFTQAGTLVINSTTDGTPTINDAGHTHDIDSHTHTTPGLTHTVNESAHTHTTPASDTKSNLDPYYVVAWLERTS
jgi:hypothetical protein